MSVPNKDRVSALKESAAYRRGLHPSTTVPSLQELVMAIREINRKARGRQNTQVQNNSANPADVAKAETLNSIHNLLKLSQCEHELFGTYKDELMGLLEAHMGSVYASNHPTMWAAQAQMAVETAVQSIQRNDDVDRCIIPGFTSAINNIIYRSVAKRHNLQVEDLLGDAVDDEPHVIEEEMHHVTPSVKVVSVTPIYTEEAATDVAPIPTPNQPEKIEMPTFKPNAVAAASDESIHAIATSTPESEKVIASPEVVADSVAADAVEQTVEVTDDGMFTRMKASMVRNAKSINVTIAGASFATAAVIGGAMLYRKFRGGDVSVPAETANALAVVGKLFFK